MGRITALEQQHDELRQWIYSELVELKLAVGARASKKEFYEYQNYADGFGGRISRLETSEAAATKELLAFVKGFHKRLCNAAAISSVEAVIKKLANLEEQVKCGISGHAFTVKERFAKGLKSDQLYRFHCTNCDIEHVVLTEDLTPHEQKLVEVVYGEIDG